MVELINNALGLNVAKRAMYLAWKASPVMGMGILHDKPNATEEQVWACVGQRKIVDAVELDSDYVFGRMMKCRLTVKEDRIAGASTVNIEYQGWAGVYKSYDDLLETALLEILG